MDAPETLTEAVALPVRADSPWAPFRHATFTLLWSAMFANSIGTWMQNAASGWLMTTLTHDPLMVALVQAATALPMFLFGFPAGALADIVDRRRLLLLTQMVTLPLVGGFAALMWMDTITPALVLGVSFVTGLGVALVTPTWQAVLPQLVPPRDLSAAVALHSFGISLGRAIGPAFLGLVIGAFGMAAPFWLYVICSLAMVAALLSWRVEARETGQLPSEHIGRAMLAGLRHARYNPELRATMIRAAGFFPFAAAYWALLPVIARNQIGGGMQGYGLLVGAIGAGAVGGTFMLPALRARIGPDRLVILGTFGAAGSMVLFALARDTPSALAASLLAGLSWIAVLATINVSAQASVPGWVRGRGLGVFAKVLFGSITIGSVAWGQLAVAVGSPGALMIAAVGLVATLPLLRSYRLVSADGIDFTPAMHWPSPMLAHAMGTVVRPERGPIQVLIEYRIRPADREAFLQAAQRLGADRLRNNAYGWAIYEDATDAGTFVESFHVESWVEHLRQKERTTEADWRLQQAVRAFQVQGKPVGRHLVAARQEAK